MEKLHTNTAPEGEGRAAVSPHAGTHGTTQLNCGATQGTQGLQRRAQGWSVTGAPTFLSWLLVFFCQAPGVGPRTFWEAACISAFTALGLQSSRGPSQTSYATPAQHGSQQAGVKMHRWGIHFRNFISGVPSS